MKIKRTFKEVVHFINFLFRPKRECQINCLNETSLDLYVYFYQFSFGFDKINFFF